MRFFYLFHKSAPPNPEMYSFAIKDWLESLHVIIRELLTEGVSKSVFEKFLHLVHYGLLSPQVHIVHCTKNPIYVFPEMKLRGP
jgi:hypothetical protein